MTRRPKKSEMLEVRLSHADKEALRAKAATEGLTVSAVVRRLIESYLGRTAEPQRLPSLGPFSMFTKPLPVTLAGVAALLGATVILSPVAHAEERMIEIAVEQRQPEGEGVRIRTAKSVVLLTEDEEVCLTLDTGEICHPSHIDAQGARLLLSVAPLENGGRVGVRLEGKADVLRNPLIEVPFGESGTYLAETAPNESLQVTVHMMTPIDGVSVSDTELR